MIRRLRSDYPLAVLCRVLDVSTSGYHAWLTRQPSKRTHARERLKVAAQAAHQRTRHTYGAVRLQKELASAGFTASLGTIKSVRRERGLAMRPTEAVLPGDDHQLAAQLAGRREPVGATLRGDAPQRSLDGGHHVCADR